jgi:hypothetical protein
MSQPESLLDAGARVGNGIPPAELAEVVERPDIKLSSAASFAEVGERLAPVKRALKEIMDENVDFGTIPGCGPKFCLLKPGAEKLKTLFQLEFTVVDKEIRDLGDGHREVEMTLRFTHLPTGWVMGDGVGSCNTRERRMQRDKGTSADVYNNCLKLAKKRALVDGILTVTGSSGFLTQDVDEDPELYQKKQPDRRPMPQLPKPQATKCDMNGNGYAAAQPNGNGSHAAPPQFEKLEGKIVRVWESEYMSQTYYHAKLADGTHVQCADKANGERLLSMDGQELHAMVELSGKPGKVRFYSFTGSLDGSQAKAEAKRTPHESVYRQILKDDVSEVDVLLAAKRLQLIPTETPSLSGVCNVVYQDLLESWPDIVDAIRMDQTSTKADA